MEEKIKSLEKKLLAAEQLHRKCEGFKLMNSRIKEYKSRLEALDSRIRSIDTQIAGYDLVDLLGDKSADINSMDLELVVSVMKDMLAANLRFKEDGSTEYLEKCDILWKKIRKVGFLRLNEIIYKSTESLIMNPNFTEFIKLLDESLVYRIQVKILQSRKVECLRKSVHIKRNREFLFKSMIQQELYIFLSLFPWEAKRLDKRLRGFKEERPLAESGLFECFSFSVLKEFFESCTMEDLESLKNRLETDLESSVTNLSNEGEVNEHGDFYANVLMFISVRHYLSSRQDYGGIQGEIVEV
ncbi:hypothetical protein EROM_050860 [Encephalitozoon romaleae SJ-2008]|uniref:Uncharacterized protein n=1 Tax=Encephalitozoon romaleae (strain SJ-2008) TaxID=1178016 RepID=I6ZIG8_ENCRO|nr:hypothetical protein EROM_050860 [Encephalitozoon romaleae SJ-2008]AFN83018.1 hypothetical protein EROM_050860 [Encephalitozoon romaleae SJ-2008]